MIVCYLDDSGEDSEPYVTLAGYLGLAADWAAFEPKARAFFDKERVEYLHTVDLHQRRGQFKGWSRDKALEFASTLFEMVGECAPVGVEFSVDKAAFASRKVELEKKGEGSPLTFCFKGLLQNMMDNKGVAEVLSWDGIDLSFVVESGRRSEPMVGEFNRLRDNDTHNGVLRSMELKGKRDFIALQAADFLAYFSRRLRCMDKTNRRFDDEKQFFETATKSVQVHSNFLATDFS